MRVLVLDNKNQFVKHIHPAEARRLLANKQAVVKTKSPFVISLVSDHKSPVVLYKGTNNMTVKNFTEFFKQERDIYVQNVSNCQVSVMFEVGPGHTESYLFTNSKDPVNLTQEIPFNAIKSSMDLRKMLNRQPPALRLIDEDEYKNYYSRAAKTRGFDSELDAIEDAAKRRSAAQNHLPVEPPPEMKQEEPAEEKTKIAVSSGQSEEDINPRVLNLCLQVHPKLDDTGKITAQTFLYELDQISDLSLLDWEYILAHGYYKTVKNLAKKKVAELALAGADEDDVPPPPKAKKAQKKTQSAEE